MFLRLVWMGVAGGAAGDEPPGLESQLPRLDEVNEGQLEFLLSLPGDTPVHHHHHALTINESTLRDGWARLDQCHNHLDPVGRAEIVFGKGRVRNLSIDHQRGIGEAWISDHSVQLADIAPASRLCLSAETRVIKADGLGGYMLQNGPFMRRFLDGYYPMRVTLSVRYPCASLEVFEIKPRPQPGFHVTRDGCAVTIDTLFEGRLTTEIRFRSSSLPPQP
nr:hypothetical protein [Gammaproteobacteria bacterium]